MSKYTKEQIEAADSIDLQAYVESRGYAIQREGQQLKLKDHDSLYIKGNRWYWFSQHKGGKAVSFLTEYEGLSFPDAMKVLLEEDGIESQPLPVAPVMEHTEPKELILPIQAENNNAAFGYLKSRGIDARLIKECMDKGFIYQTNMFWKQNEAGEYEQNACPPQTVFVGFDMTAQPRYACTRSCTGTGKHDAYGSDKSYAFAFPDGNSKAVWVFESAIDLLSHMTLCNYSKNKYPAHRVSLGGVVPVALVQFLQDRPQIKYINLALDNDEQGREATESIRKLLGDRYTVYDHPPVHGKDYNEDLLFRQALFQEKRRSIPQEER